MDLGQFAVGGRHVRALYLDGIPVTPGGVPTSLAGRYTGSESISFRIWRGDDQTADATLVAVWDPDLPGNPASVDSPKIRLTLDNLTGVTPGIYYVEVVIDPAGAKTQVLEPGSTLELTPSPGVGTTRPLYCTFEDVRDVAGWLARAMEEHPAARSDLGDQRDQARSWVDDTVVSRVDSLIRDWNLSNWWPYSAVSSATFRTALVEQAQAAAIAGQSSLGAALQYVRAAVAAGGLVVDDRIRRAAAYRAAYLVCLPLYGMPTYRDLGIACRRLSCSELDAAVFRIDVDGDGNPDIEV